MQSIAQVNLLTRYEISTFDHLMLKFRIMVVRKIATIGCFLFGVLMLAMVTHQASAQTVTGEVIDAQSQETLPGVNILVKGTSIGTSSDADGEFSLKVPSLSDTLVFTFIGYQRLEVPLQGQSSLDVSLTPETIAGD